ncbi:serine hydrolase-like protein [Atheta coriaria]|uniref:serine hydrolase-like protein n=1 Tax=Dalotia coriaria TaxID=877792 RepID=UPI0031F4000C
MNELEVEICVPWGQVTCKIMAENMIKTNDIILFLHDLHDNAASFDQLIENFKENHMYLAIDLPGHGKSSSAYPHATYHFIDFVLTIKYVIYRLLHQFRQNQSIKQVVIVAHGKSAHTAAVFTQIYPKLISKLILLDDMYNYGVPATDFSKIFKQINENYFAVEKIKMTKSPEEFTFDDVLEIYKNKYSNDKIKFYEMLGDISEIESGTAKTVRAIARRSCRQIDNGKYLMRNDLQLKNMLMHTSGFDYMIDFLRKQPIMCPTVILCTQAKTTEHKTFLNTLKSKNSHVNIIKVPFDNYHIKKPRETANILGNFLSINKNQPSESKL